MTSSPRAAQTSVLAVLAVLAASCASTGPAPRAGAAAGSSVCDSPVVIGHRGAPRNAPENTMASFEAALGEGADWLETDVQTTRDGVPVLMHDPTVDRTTDGRGAVADLTAAQVAALRVTVGPGPAEPVPTLEQLLDRLSGSSATLLMEIKWQRPEDVARIARIAASSSAHVVLYSFSAEHLRQAHAVAPALPVVLIQSGAIADSPGDLKLSGIALAADLASAARIAAERRAGREVYVWTLDDEESWQLMSARGADGLITDTPGPARRWVDTNCHTEGRTGPLAHGRSPNDQDQH
ncbi:glycerophosphodiester phosphodiesterase [Kitasatospora sp. SUK 42]|uniref:glycerophosphodiester phosphodiesterase n=1 Tax=Kitasatospora sp. SUK 42 TaxID=1588882 RepID=UPI0018CAEAFF|nr:glycerophosphodiester phosphodiesterase [Kitasatospora sp. SUK 42]MBV2154595.1 glycerophosphodiester phosphodiesterase [Kitasatospora sp. SUK 42]